MFDERIEAKLAAYIDGILPPAERLEIEQHLAANPRQAQMIEEMLQARRWLATLPRVAAPADLLDSIDPMLERSALLSEEPVESVPWTTRWLSPQVLALAASLALVLTLLTAMVFLTVDRNDAYTIAAAEPQEPEEPSQTSPVAPAPGVTRDGIITRNDLRNGLRPGEFLPRNGAPGSSPRGTDPLPPDQQDGPLAETPLDPDDLDHDPLPSQPQQPMRMPRVPRDSLLVNAQVQNIPEASGRVAHFLATEELSHAGQRMPVAELPPAIRDQLNLPAEQRVMVYVVEDIRMAQVGELTAQLSRVGTSRVVTPRWDRLHMPHRYLPVERQNVDDDDRALAAERRRQQQLREQARNIYSNDQITVSVTRPDDADPAPRPGVPQLPRGPITLNIQVTPEGYADLSELGLGQLDVLGQEPRFLAEHIQQRLSEDFLISSSVSAFISRRWEPREGRRNETVQLINLERQPLRAGDLLQIEYADGSWMQAVIEEDGQLHAGRLGLVEAAGRSTMSLQEALRQIERGLVPGNEESNPPADQEPLRLVNLTARRSLDLDTQANNRVPIVIVLEGEMDDAAPAPADPWAPLDDPGQPAHQP